MYHTINQQETWLSRQREKLSAICRWAAEALSITEGEFWVWYGSPFLLPRGFDR